MIDRHKKKNKLQASADNIMLKKILF